MASLEGNDGLSIASIWPNGRGYQALAAQHAYNIFRASSIDDIMKFRADGDSSWASNIFHGASAMKQMMISFSDFSTGRVDAWFLVLRRQYTQCRLRGHRLGLSCGSKQRHTCCHVSFRSSATKQIAYDRDYWCSLSCSPNKMDESAFTVISQ